jgi:hypothetical protein
MVSDPTAMSIANESWESLALMAFAISASDRIAASLSPRFTK